MRDASCNHPRQVHLVAVLHIHIRFVVARAVEEAVEIVTEELWKRVVGRDGGEEVNARALDYCTLAAA